MRQSIPHFDEIANQPAHAVLVSLTRQIQEEPHRTAQSTRDEPAYPNAAPVCPDTHEEVENRHRGSVALVDIHQDRLWGTTDAMQATCFFRSSAKPFQAFPLVESGVHQHMSPAELAITCASHTGTDRHVSLAQAVLAPTGLPAAALQCGPHPPHDDTTRQHLCQTHQPPTSWHNNCSGKHAGMLRYCHHHHLPVATYLEPTHPLQQRIIQILKQWGDAESIALGVDGCGAPVFYIPLQSAARLYAHLGCAPEFAPLRHAMAQHPDVIGGFGQADTAIMQASQGRLLAKVGADGVMAVSRVDSGQGLALKLDDGNNHIRNWATIQLLIHLGWLDAGAQQDPALQPFLETRRLNTQGRTVGHHYFYPPEQLPVVTP